MVKITKGYSGADLHSLCTEASMIPVRELGDLLAEIDNNNIRQVNLEDFKKALDSVKATVNQKDLHHLMNWNDENGNMKIKYEDLNT